MLAENGFWHEIATQGHSRSFTSQSLIRWQGVAYRHYNIAGLISEVSEEVAAQIDKNCRRRILIWGPRQEEPPARMSTYTLYSRN